jgi:hypothetical protein
MCPSIDASRRFSLPSPIVGVPHRSSDLAVTEIYPMPWICREKYAIFFDDFTRDFKEFARFSLQTGRAATNDPAGGEKQ